jgi:hypothetical protein
VVDLLVIMAVLAGVVVFVTAPLRRTPAPGMVAVDALGPETSRLGELEAARDAKLRELRDAELDHRTGKLSDADYASVDDALRAEAIEILRALDEAREGLAGDADQDRPAADTIED